MIQKKLRKKERKGYRRKRLKEKWQLGSHLAICSMKKTGSKASETGSGHTLLALDCHSGLQVVHLQLQAFECAVGVAGLALVCDEDYDDDEQQQASSGPDADDGGQGEQTVRIDLQRTRGVLEPSNTHLHHTHVHTHKYKHTFFFFFFTKMCEV